MLLASINFISTTEQYKSFDFNFSIIRLTKMAKAVSFVNFYLFSGIKTKLKIVDQIVNNINNFVYSVLATISRQ